MNIFLVFRQKHIFGANDLQNQSKNIKKINIKSNKLGLHF